MVGRKFECPKVPDGVQARPRLDKLYAELLAEYGIIEVVAGAGSGKTVQTRLYAQSCKRERLVWLTLDARDRSGSNLLHDLECALARANSTGGPAPRAGKETVRNSLQSGATGQEAAALLAAAIEGRRYLIVIDECEHISGSTDAITVLDAFLDCLSEKVQVILLSRAELQWPFQRRRIEGSVGLVMDRDLNFTLAETIDYLGVNNHDADAAERVYAGTGGWVAAVAVGARYGFPEEEFMRDFSNYIESQVVGPLPIDEQDFLMTTAAIDNVTRESAVAVFGDDAQRIWAQLMSRHLPGLSISQDEMGYHSLLRKHLLERLLCSRPDAHREIRRRYAEHLARAREYESATEIWLELGEYDAAIETAAPAVRMMCERSDFVTVLRWFTALGEERVLTNDALVAAWIRSVCGERQFDEAANLILRLDREGRLRSVLEQDRALLFTTAWALQGRPQAALDLLDKFVGDHRSNAVRFMIEVTSSPRPTCPPYGDTWDDATPAMSWGLLLQGRVSELATLAPADTDVPLMNATVVLAPVFQGDWAAAAQAWARVPLEIRDRPHSRFVEAMVQVVMRRYDVADGLLRRAISDSRRAGFGPTSAYEVFAAYVLLVTGDIERARELLLSLVEVLADRRQMAYLEWAQCMLGVANLRSGRIAEAALLLREALASMQRSQRRLFLPLAAIALAEAQYLEGDLSGSHESAELAYEVAKSTGNLAVLNWALHLFDDVRRREMNKDPQDSRWRRVFAAPSARPTRAVIDSSDDDTSSVLCLQPFGRKHDLLIDGVPQNIGRIKLLELVACVARNPGGIDRYLIQEMLFPEVSQRSGANYFRQVVHRFKQQTGVTLNRSGNLLSFPSDVRVVTMDEECESLLASASGLTDEGRIERLTAGLRLITGAYLEGSTLGWAEERRNHLQVVQEEARLELANLQFKFGNPSAARELCEEVLASNPYSDPAYRILVAIERKHGSETSLVVTYNRARKALAELGLRPGDARRLLDQGIVLSTHAAK